MGDQMRRAFEDFVAAECAAGPVLVVLEDLQWGDLPSLGFVGAALRNLAHAPLFVLGLARPDHELGIAGGTNSFSPSTSVFGGCAWRQASSHKMPKVSAASTDACVSCAFTPSTANAVRPFLTKPRE